MKIETENTSLTNHKQQETQLAIAGPKGPRYIRGIAESEHCRREYAMQFQVTPLAVFHCELVEELHRHNWNEETRTCHLAEDEMMWWGIWLCIIIWEPKDCTWTTTSADKVNIKPGSAWSASSWIAALTTHTQRSSNRIELSTASAHICENDRSNQVTFASLDRAICSKRCSGLWRIEVRWYRVADSIFDGKKPFNTKGGTVGEKGAQ